jgi:FkbM family methyltransferase
MNYSQNDEQEQILRFFGGKVGAFLDIGAYDGVRLSNTRALLGNGWRGVLVEPSPLNLINLSRNCEAHADRVQIVQAAVSDYRGLADFFIDTAPDREWSTTINRELLASGSVIAPRRLQTSTAVIRIGDLLRFGPFDFLSLDAEWEDLKILNDMREHHGNVLSALAMICIEARNADERALMRAILDSFGFILYHETKENLLMVHA